MDAQADGGGLTLSRFAAAAWRRAWIVVLVTGAAALAGHAVALDHPRVHVAKALLLVGPLKAGIDTLGASGPMAETYAELARSRPVLAETARRVRQRSVGANLEVSANQTTRLLTVEARRPRSGHRCAARERPCRLSRRPRLAAPTGRDSVRQGAGGRSRGGRRGGGRARPDHAHDPRRTSAWPSRSARSRLSRARAARSGTPASWRSSRACRAWRASGAQPSAAAGRRSSTDETLLAGGGWYRPARRQAGRARRAQPRRRLGRRRAWRRRRGEPRRRARRPRRTRRASSTSRRRRPAPPPSASERVQRAGHQRPRPAQRRPRRSRMAPRGSRGAHAADAAARRVGRRRAAPRGRRRLARWAGVGAGRRGHAARGAAGATPRREVTSAVQSLRLVQARLAGAVLRRAATMVMVTTASPLGARADARDAVRPGSNRRAGLSVRPGRCCWTTWRSATWCVSACLGAQPGTLARHARTLTLVSADRRASRVVRRRLVGSRARGRRLGAGSRVGHVGTVDLVVVTARVGPGGRRPTGRSPASCGEPRRVRAVRHPGRGGRDATPLDRVVARVADGEVSLAARTRRRRGDRAAASARRRDEQRRAVERLRAGSRGRCVAAASPRAVGTLAGLGTPSPGRVSPFRLHARHRGGGRRAGRRVPRRVGRARRLPLPQSRARAVRAGHAVAPLRREARARRRAERPAERGSRAADARGARDRGRGDGAACGVLRPARRPRRAAARPRSSGSRSGRPPARRRTAPPPARHSRG